ncbi:hypothetical protein RN001_005687 [Aquatica leii]|uniref:Regulatory protein zeste n=1 Tax=Aquatica leii TaxID=1421715 RepID=A0AAN7PD18_9COLE|nr:hypothetical protein RN001_005687 [Aquatica leii]
MIVCLHYKSGCEKREIKFWKLWLINIPTSVFFGKKKNICIAPANPTVSDVSDSDSEDENISSDYTSEAIPNTHIILQEEASNSDCDIFKETEIEENSSTKKINNNNKSGFSWSEADIPFTPFADCTLGWSESVNHGRTTRRKKHFSFDRPHGANVIHILRKLKLAFFVKGRVTYLVLYSVVHIPAVVIVCLMIMGDYEKEQARIQTLLNEILSDDELYQDSSESYNPSDLSDVSTNSYSVTARKRQKVFTTESIDDAAWQKIGEEYNCGQLETRTVDQLRSKFDNLKKETRRYFAKQRQDLYQTAGGVVEDNIRAILKLLYNKIRCIINLSVLGLEAFPGDSDMIATDNIMCPGPPAPSTPPQDEEINKPRQHRGKDVETLKNLYQEEEDDLTSNILDGLSQRSEDVDIEIFKVEDLEKQFIIKLKDAYKNIKLKLSSSDKKCSAIKRQVVKENSEIDKLKKKLEFVEKQYYLEFGLICFNTLSLLAGGNNDNRTRHKLRQDKMRQDDGHGVALLIYSSGHVDAPPLNFHKFKFSGYN